MLGSDMRGIPTKGKDEGSAQDPKLRPLYTSFIALMAFALLANSVAFVLLARSVLTGT
jgi:hypothetical protein